MYRAGLVAAAVLALIGCAQLNEAANRGRHAKIPVGSVVQVERRIPIPVDRSRVWIQGNRLSTSHSRYEPVCGLEVREIDPINTRYVEPGEFRVRRVQNMWAEVVWKDSSPDGMARFQLASVGGGDGGTPMIYEGYHLWLENPDQPDVMRLTCLGVFDDMPFARPPTIAEIRESLGRYATLVLLGG